MTASHQKASSLARLRLRQRERTGHGPLRHPRTQRQAKLGLSVQGSRRRLAQALHGVDAEAV
jgi:hypothetical protein